MLRPLLHHVLFALAVSLSPVAGAAEPGHRGPAKVIDAVSLVVGGARYRLFGIDAPDPGQVCERFGRAYPCGAVARTALMDLVAGARVSCRPVTGARAKLSGQRDSHGTTIGLCQATGVDLSWNMVHTGWALADPIYGRRYYDKIERSAKSRKAGLWRGRFTLPWRWRTSQLRLRDAGGKQICLRGRLTGGGIECQAMRSNDGRLYTLGQPKVVAKTGAEICACGRIVTISNCMQGTTIVVTRMGHPDSCPKTK